MFLDKRDVLIRTGSRERTDAALYSLLRLLTGSKTERKLLKKSAKAARRDARRIARLTGEKSKTNVGGLLAGVGSYLLFGKEYFYREEARREHGTGKVLLRYAEETPKLAPIVIHSEKRAKREEKYAGKTAKIAAREEKTTQKRAQKRTKRAYKRAMRYYKR
ncbi:MAG: hypothetical protein J5849_07950 [Clostridia bacterium]|nr:hypothetical protein [Clostridia bacterium]